MKEKSIRTACYPAKTWQSYRDGSLTAEESAGLEEHLLDCEQCLETYLELVQQGSDRLEPGLSPDFTERLLAIIKPEEQRKEPERGVKERNSRATLLIGYCAAACIALFFWMGGYFDGISGGLAKQGIIQRGWTEKVNMEAPPSFLNNILRQK